MQAESLTLVPLSLGTLAGLLALATGAYLARRILARAKGTARVLLADARAEAENRKKEILVAAQERMLVQEEEAERRERDLDERESALEGKSRKRVFHASMASAYCFLP